MHKDQLMPPEYIGMEEIRSWSHDHVSAVERAMQPNSFSKVGFIGKQEKLVPLLEKDNRYVVSLGFSHETIAGVFYELLKVKKRGLPCDLWGRTYSVSVSIVCGEQPSPFLDDYSTSVNLNIKNPEGKPMSLSFLQPYMIAKYGFYQGDVPYRLDPQRIIDFFQLKSMTRK